MAKTYYFKKKKTNLYTVAFYNLENLFDTSDNPHILDDEFMAQGEKKWDIKRYHKKVFKLGTAISNIGFANTGKAPSLIGVAEVENKKVLEDLISTKHLCNKNYGIIHYESPDERGIDVGLLYQKDVFEVIDSKSVPLLLIDEQGIRDFTRDILWVTGKLNDERLHVLVNHWPSRRDGGTATTHKRIAAAEKNREIITTIRSSEPDAKIIIMGDFNDDPSSTSVKTHLLQEDLYNPMELLHTRYEGTVYYRGQWNLFDQIIFSSNFHQYQPLTHSFSHAAIFDNDFLKIQKGRYKGAPFRTYGGGKYIGGYSDHFPVYVQLKLNA